jgi:hypothetical protein
MKTGSGADTNGRGGVAVGNTANGIDGVGDVSVFWNAAGADGDTTNGGVGKASFVPKTNSSITARVVCVCWYSCQHSHDFLKQSAVLFIRI